MSRTALSPHLKAYSNSDDHSMQQQYCAVVGIGAAGFSELGYKAQQLIINADVVVGSWRQLHLIPDDVSADKHPLPAPLLPALPKFFARLEEQYRRIVFLASGDPLFHGIGNTLLRLFPDKSFHIIPAVSSASLACSRLGWSVADTSVFSLVSNDISVLHRALDENQRFLVLGRDEQSPHDICQLLSQRHLSNSRVTVLSDLGSVDEQIIFSSAHTPPEVTSSLNVIAVEPHSDDLGQDSIRSLTPGLSDHCYQHDGQLTKQHIRALTVCALQPRNGETLWDIGAGAGSVAIEFLRTTKNSHAICFESIPSRQENIMTNAHRLGVKRHIAIQGQAPQAFDSVPDAPDVIFIGGGLTNENLFHQAWLRLKQGGRLVANAVTIESEQLLWQLHKNYGGDLTKINVATQHSIGSFSAWRPAYPITQWVVVKKT
ncbi:precorrin-6y C5,15-methyltransferase (decarboxylating) subunit CbiE [Corynebacterium sp. sy039]|uniref:precorrin-6y C5,15-methyltransferase (decarboxylating) subunit CbiE n=1 Tax=Corynebacterium sp. sy039 TaxID=2599641 RepID=UPI0011B5D509|nr:precorrin-6y C5,15-methyltransferase (decarboxylating) subunit CbiE [Corynebacterium sp. sy039]QDZ42595.1 precorrin-6y C5,15-methyltransferase (decarboxylating) subunit CbiE [Corynebacterium sp. sy039]